MNKKKILIVDDNPTLLKLGVAIFETGGYDIVTANNGAEALHILLNKPIDLVITDILMPIMDGYTLCHTIRNNEKCKNIPIIIYSATYISDIDKQLALEIGADVFIKKPAGMDFLLKAAKDLITLPRETHYKPNQLHLLSEVTRQYNLRMIEKLVQKNEALEKSQNALLKSERRFRALLENSFEAISIVDEKGIVLYQSPSTERMLGYAPEEVIGKIGVHFFHPDDKPGVLNRIEKAIMTPGIPIHRLNRMRHKDGHYIWAEGTTTNLLEDDNVKGIVANFRDVTERISAEEKLLNASRLYVFLSQINQAIVHSKNEEILFKEVCRIAIDIGKFELVWIGIPDIANKKLNLVAHNNATTRDLDFINAFVYDNLGPTANVLISGKSFIVNDFADVHETGSMKYFGSTCGYRSFIVLPLKKSGETIGLFNLFSKIGNLFDTEEVNLLEEAAGDISFALDVFEKEKHRKLIEDQLLHKEIRLTQAQSIAHIGSWELYFSTGVAIWSDEQCRIYGLSPGDNNQSFESWQSFIHPEDFAVTMKIVNEARAISMGTSFYHRIVRRDASIRYLHAQNKFEFNAEGNPIGIHGISQDITEEKEAEADRNKMIADMVQRNKDLEQFSYIVSHNLRGPVASILGLVDLFRSEDLHKRDEVECLNGLFQTAMNLDNVIHDLNAILELKNPENKKTEPVRFSVILNEVKQSIGKLIEEEKAIIKSDFSSVDAILSSRGYIHSIFLNIISNSIKYRQKDISPVINISAIRSEDKIILSFKDNGLGIDLEKQGAKVFGLYKRFHAHTEGKGMGLFMVKTQVESLGGKIAIKSGINKGTEIIIEFEGHAIS